MSRNTYLLSRFSISIFALFYCISCSSGGGGGSTDDDGGGGQAAAPSQATLVFPANNTLCNEGTVVSDTQSTVEFLWSESNNTDSYEVTVRNLNTNSGTTRTSTTNSLEITIDRSAPFEWFVVSRSDQTTQTAQSAVAVFYNEGPGVENYAPFPAEAVSPSSGANLATSVSEVTLNWSASDLDNDIENFDVFIGTDENNLTALGQFQSESSDPVAVSPGTTYYWKVHTNDETGNTSISPVFSFRIL